MEICFSSGGSIKGSSQDRNLLRFEELGSQGRVARNAAVSLGYESLLVENLLSLKDLADVSSGSKGSSQCSFTYEWSPRVICTDETIYRNAFFLPPVQCSIFPFHRVPGTSRSTTIFFQDRCEKRNGNGNGGACNWHTSTLKFIVGHRARLMTGRNTLAANSYSIKFATARPPVRTWSAENIT